MTILVSRNYVVQIGSTVVLRAQNFTQQETVPTTQTFQLGSSGPTGVDQDPLTVNASLTWNPISWQVEELVSGETINPGVNTITLNELMGGSAVKIGGGAEQLAMDGAKFSSLTYSVTDQGSRWQGVMNFIGTNLEAGTGSPAAPTTDGIGTYKGKHVMVEFGEATPKKLTRVSAIDVSITTTEDRAYELSNNEAWDIDRHSPVVTLGVTWHGIGPAGTDPDDYRPTMTPENALDVEIQIGPLTGAVPTWDAGGNLKLILKNMCWTDRAENIAVQGRAQHPFNYYSIGDAASGGVIWDIVPTS